MEPTENSNQVRIGGDLEQALKGQYQIDVKAILSEAWSTTGSNWRPLALASATTLALTFLGAMALVQLILSSGGPELTTEVLLESSALWQSNLLLTALVAPFFGGLAMMGVRGAVNLPCRAGQVFDVVRLIIPLALAALLSSLLVNLGVGLFLLPGIYLMVGTSMATTLIIEKRLTPLKAIWFSIRGLHHNWLKFFQLYTAAFLLFLLAMIPMGLGLIWVSPFYYNLKGIIYREVFGIRVGISHHPSTPDKPQSAGVFHA